MTPTFLCLTARFLDPLPMFHGRDDGGEPEWPPSPLRIFQALIAAASARWRGPQFVDYAVPALKRLATLTPVIITPGIQRRRTPYRMYVPHNAGDLMTSAWDRGDIDASMAKHRIEKDVWPTRLISDERELPAIRYLYTLPPSDPEFGQAPKVITEAARSITHLGQGIDMVTANASIIDGDTASKLPGERWHPATGGTFRLRVPRDDTLDGLIRRHKAYLNRIGPEGFNPVARLSEFSVVSYQPASAPIARPFIVFELLKDDDSRFSYAQNKFVHLAGMVRHLAIESMTNSKPEDVPDDWVNTYVAGHAKPGDANHRQFSYLPLPSIGHAHTDPSVRRVMIAAPAGDERVLNHLARLLAGQQLKPTGRTKLDCPPTLVFVRRDSFARFYTQPTNVWASVTPVILPGHDDHKPEKRRRLIKKALQQSGIDQPCEFEWSSISHFPKSLSAHKYDRQKRPTGYIRPDHLLDQTAIHLKIQFNDGSKIPGPIVIGSGRHCGFGLMAGIN
jgi:CRISPR-associated protein Csb2